MVFHCSARLLQSAVMYLPCYIPLPTLFCLTAQLRFWWSLWSKKKKRAEPSFCKLVRHWNCFAIESQAKNNGDPQACLSSMVTEWLKRNYNVKRFGEPTWQWLVHECSEWPRRWSTCTALARDIARRHKARGVPNHTASFCDTFLFDCKVMYLVLSWVNMPSSICSHGLCQ